MRGEDGRTDSRLSTPAHRSRRVVCAAGQAANGRSEVHCRRQVLGDHRRCGWRARRHCATRWENRAYRGRSRVRLSPPIC